MIKLAVCVAASGIAGILVGLWIGATFERAWNDLHNSD